MLEAATLLFLAVPAPHPYRLELRPKGDSGTQIRIFNGAKGAVLWTRTVGHVLMNRWSDDGRSLAIVDRDDRGRLRLLVWQNSHPTTSRAYLNLPGFESMSDLVWSPDRQRLLLRGPLSQGEGDQGFGRLWCLRLKDGELQHLSNASITRAKWAGHRAAQYWIGTYVRDPNGGPRLVLQEQAHRRCCE